MPNNISGKLDLNQLAKRIAAEATKTLPPRLGPQAGASKGGKKGGKTRMEALTDEQRHELAMKGVAARKKAPAVQAGAALLKK